MNSPDGALHHSDFWDLVEFRISIHRASITQLSSHSLDSSSQSRILCDALLLGTGFTSSLTFFSDSLKTEHGLPHQPIVDSKEHISLWNDLESKADSFVWAKFPILATSPPHRSKKARTTRYRLYRGILPIGDLSRSIILINFLVAGNLIVNAEVQAMWAVAYLISSSSLSLSPVKVMRNETMLRVAWCKRRYLSTGLLDNFVGSDGILYTTLLSKDLIVDELWKATGKWE
jgi:dimethylaniline monooxygenase (N-oxide forming)